MDLREDREREGDAAKLKDCVTTEELKSWCSQYNFQGFVECSAKDKKGLNQVFLTAFKVVFQVREVQANPGAHRPLTNQDGTTIDGKKKGSDGKDKCCSI